MLVRVQNSIATLEIVTKLKFLTKLSRLFLYDLIIVLFGIYPNELKTYIYAKTCTWMLIVALCIIAKTEKQSRYTSVSEWINCGASRQ